MAALSVALRSLQPTSNEPNALNTMINPNALKDSCATRALGKITRVRPPQLPSVRVEADLRRRIAAGEWASGEALPTVADLARHYATSGATVSKVLRKLAADGLLTVIPSWGTFRA